MADNNNTNATTAEAQTNARRLTSESTTSCGDVALSQCPALQKCLPPGYDYHVCSVEVTQKEFDHPALSATIRLALKTEEEAKEWFLKTRCTPVTWRVTTKKACSGKKVIYKMVYRCQHHVTVKSDTANNRRTSKNTDCPAKMTLTVKHVTGGDRRKSESKDPHMPQFPTVITLQNDHNHDIYSAATMKHRDVGQKAIETLTKLFEIGHNPPSALSVLQSDLQAKYGDDYVYIAADRATCPDLKFCYSLYKKLFKKERNERRRGLAASLQEYTGEQDGSSTHDEHEGDYYPLEEPNTEEDEVQLMEVFEDIRNKLRDDPTSFRAPVRSFVENYKKGKCAAISPRSYTTTQRGRPCSCTCHQNGVQEARGRGKAALGGEKRPSGWTTFEGLGKRPSLQDGSENYSNRRSSMMRKRKTRGLESGTGSKH